MSEESPMYGKRLPRNRADVKSDEEWSVVRWLHDAVRIYLVSAWSYEPETLTLFAPEKYEERKQLKTKVKMVQRCLHRGAVYTPDFRIDLTKKGSTLLYEAFKESLLTGKGSVVYIDVKGAFNPHDQPRYFSVMQKIVYSIHGLWVKRIVPFHKTRGVAKGLFYETYAPDYLRQRKDGRGLTSCGKCCRSVEEFDAGADQ